MQRFSTVGSQVLILAALIACSSRAGKADDLPDRFAQLIQPGDLLTVRSTAGAGTFDLVIVATPVTRGARQASELHVVEAVKADYIAVESSSYQQYIPFNRIRSVYRTRPQLLEVTRITHEFRRAPLKDVVSIVGNRMNIDFLIDREALKSEGYSLNMAVSMTADDVPAGEFLDALCTKYEGLAVTAHRDHYLLTSLKGARKDLAIAPLVVPRPKP